MTIHEPPANNPCSDDADGELAGWFDDPERALVRRLARWQAAHPPGRPMEPTPTNHPAVPAEPVPA